jgi:hypothetical protein
MSRDTRYQSNRVAPIFRDIAVLVGISTLKELQDQKVQQQYHEFRRVCFLLYWTAAISDKVLLVLRVFAISTCVLINVGFNNADHVASNARTICESKTGKDVSAA